MSFSYPYVNRFAMPSGLTSHEVSFVAGLLAALFSLVFFILPSQSQFQRVGKPWLFSFLSGRHAMSFTMEKHIQEGYTQVIKKTGKPFVMKWWAMDYVFLPPKYLLDLKRADPHSLSFFENISNAFSLYSSVGDLYSSDLMVDVVKRGINTRLPTLIPLLNEECDYAFTKEIGSPTDWTPFPAATLFGSIMHRTTSRILMGPELCRPFRRVMCYLLSIFHRMNIRKAMAVVLPIVQTRFAEFQDRSRGNGKNAAERLDAIEWSLELSKDNAKEHDPNWIALSLLHNIWAGSAAPGGLVTQMVFQVLAQPHYLDPLRAEAARAIETHGCTDKALSSMTLMDSFIRELNRLYPTGAVTCARTVMDPHGFRFHDGLELPRGARIAVPALAIQTDPENFKDPLAFDGFRFAKLNAAASAVGNSDEGEQKWGASTVSETNLAFGFGKHSCTGRFYAVRKAKLIFSKLILKYDIKWEGSKTRPASLSVNGQFAPNQSQKVFLRERMEYRR